MGFFQSDYRLFFPFGGLLYKAGVTLYSSCLFFLSSAPVLIFGVVGVNACVLHTAHTRGWDGEGETGKLLQKSDAYSRIKYLQREKHSHGGYSTNECEIV